MFYKIFPQTDGQRFVSVATYDSATRLTPDCPSGRLAESCGAVWHRASQQWRLSPRRARLMDRLAREGWRASLHQWGIEVGEVYHPATHETLLTRDVEPEPKRCARTLEMAF